jgi:hypothetical protein
VFWKEGQDSSGLPPPSESAPQIVALIARQRRFIDTLIEIEGPEPGLTMVDRAEGADVAHRIARLEQHGRVASSVRETLGVALGDAQARSSARP